ncbi:MAG: rod shape-determining protein MreC [Alphaproteobacteria bacterium]|nr:rod shape-determining protein MreC [Alphaproteobacteria bacterium]
MAKQRTGTATRIAVPLRALAQRFAFFLLVLSAFALMLLGKAETVVIERVRGGIVDVVSPLMHVAAEPLAAVSRGIETLHDLFSLREENTRLREQNARLLEWQTIALRLTHENAHYRTLLEFVPDPNATAITARIFADSSGVFVHSMLINAGSRDGVGRGQAVVTGAGLAGRITTVGERSARVLLVTDLNSRIPVLVESSRDNGILAGDNTRDPRLVFLPQNSVVAPGDRIVTSGQGGVFPPGIPIGVVGSVGEGVIRVRPLVDLDRIETVRVINYPGIEGVLPAERAAPARKRP